MAINHVEHAHKSKKQQQIEMLKIVGINKMTNNNNHITEKNFVYMYICITNH